MATSSGSFERLEPSYSTICLMATNKISSLASGLYDHSTDNSRRRHISQRARVNSNRFALANVLWWETRVNMARRSLGMHRIQEFFFKHAVWPRWSCRGSWMVSLAWSWKL